MKTITFMANSGNLSLEVDVANKEVELEAYCACLLPFFSYIGPQIPIIESFQRNTIETRDKVKSVVQNFGKNSPCIYQLYDYFFKSLVDGEWFYVSSKDNFSQEELIDISSKLKLKMCNASDSESKLCAREAEMLRKLNRFYTISQYGGNLKVNTGEVDKNKRVCRYCHRSMPEVTFKEVAHTIPEALGNKNIKTNDECDECNHQFGATIEQDFLSYFEATRLIFDIKGKNGVPRKVKGQNFEMAKDIEGILDFKYVTSQEETTKEDSPQYFTLKSSRKFPIQNIYKALSKFAMGVLDDETLKSFEPTRRWLMGIDEREELPNVAFIYNTKVRLHPRITTYVKHSDIKNDLPHVVVELSFANIVFLYVLPFSEKDTIVKGHKEMILKFLFFSDLHREILGWKMIDFSSCEGRHQETTLVIE